MTIIYANTNWEQSPAELTLNDGELHVWAAALEPSAECLEDYRQIISLKETRQASHFASQSSRERYIAAHAILRILLARYLGTAAAKLEFTPNAFGKPSLVPGQASGSLQFNMSHSDKRALYAVTRNQAVGIDIEMIRPTSEIDQVIARSFSTNERRAVQSAAPDEKLKVFYRIWTCKEAYIKAKGLGLSMPLEQFDLFDSSIKVCALKNVQANIPTEPHNSGIQEYAAALATVDHHPYRLSCLNWQPETTSTR